jgi:hypothetical protein
MEEANGNVCCKCPHHKIFPLLVVLFGLDFLLGTLNVFSAYTVNIIWPIIIIIIGFMKMGRGCKCCCKG